MLPEGYRFATIILKVRPNSSNLLQDQWTIGNGYIDAENMNQSSKLHVPTHFWFKVTKILNC